ncbi:hypothetical protein ES689_14080 [Frigoribacterium sp. ACAM 257]|uniref:hypothetical protein n=1 Tax=Frigoribacterium sp. ACAM 257 TaxID=2508998 RepID=UPI0011BA0A28|nr:hypothetical protein [Frigoribacterium sp. ACAM 257]TWX34968.1 hypothetical protein ES689_14080 [Frigoribacterium sp. ACAM 257]
MTRRLRTLLLVVGGVVTAVGGSLTLLYLFQPWRTCSYDDTPSACAMLPGDAAVLALSAVGTLVGATVLLAGLLSPRLAAG